MEMGAPFLMFCPEWIWVGRGCLEQIVPEARKLRVQKALIITDPGIHEAGISVHVKEILEKGGIKTEIFKSVQPEPPFEVVDESAKVAKAEKVDLLIGLGGGSSMDTAKGTSVVITNGGSIKDYFGIDMVPKPGLPTFLIPTTSGTGAEVTRNAIFKDIKAKAKKAVVTRNILPRVAIVDPELMLTTPPRVTAYTGMDALSHAFDSFLAKNSNPLSEMYALKTIKLVPEYLPRAVENGNDLIARENMALAALCGGMALIAGGIGIGGTSYPVEGHFGIPHGVGNAIMMPYVMRYTAPANIPKAKKIAEQFEIDIRGLRDPDVVDRIVDRITALIKKVGLPIQLGEVGVKERDVPLLAEEAFQNKRVISGNPREFTLESITEIYHEAL